MPQGSVLGPILYIIYTGDLPTPSGVIVDTFADDTILSTAFHPKLASANLQESLYAVSKWFKEWRIKVNETKSVQVTFSLRKQNCPQVSLNNINLPQSNTVKHLGLHLDRKLNWRDHILAKRKADGI